MSGVEKLASVRRWFWTVAIDVCLIFNVAAVFSSKYFRFLVCTAQFIGDWLENRRGAPNCFTFFLLHKLMFGAPLVMAQGASVRQ
jgi:hypothetical protein